MVELDGSSAFPVFKRDSAVAFSFEANCILVVFCIPPRMETWEKQIPGLLCLVLRERRCPVNGWDEEDRSVPFASWEISSLTKYTPCHSNLNSTVHLWSESVVSCMCHSNQDDVYFKAVAVLSICSPAVKFQPCVVSTGGNPTTFGFSLCYRDLDRRIPSFIQGSLAVMEVHSATAVQCDKTWPYVKSLAKWPPLAC